MRYNTNNPVGADGSSSPFDLHDNAGNIDVWANDTTKLQWPDRLGVQRKTWAGIEQQVTDYLISQGYESAYLVYGAGVVVERQTQLVQRSGELYRVMNAADIPLTLTGTWAIDAPKLQAVGDAALRPLVASLSEAIKSAGVYNFFSQNAAADVLFIGDSNGAGVGQNGGYVGGYMGRVARSLMNAFDKAPGANRGYMYFTWLNGYQQLLSEGGWTQDGGSPVAGGPAGGAWRMPSGAWAEKTGAEVSQGRVFFAPSNDGSSMQVSVNGVPASTFSVNTDGFSANFGLATDLGYIKPSDKIRFTCTSGTIDVYSFRLMRKGGSNGPIVYCTPEGSQSFSDYTDPARADLLGRYVNADQASAPKLICCFLGTNNMVTYASKQKTPASMVGDMQAFVSKYRSMFPGCVILFWVPPRPRADVEIPYGPYEDYVTAMEEFVASQSNIGLIPMHLSGVEGADVYADPDIAPGVHLNSYGHAAAAKAICSYLGIPIDTSNPGFAEYPQSGTGADGSWTKYSDGTMECWMSRVDSSVAVDVALNGGFRSAAISWSFPVAFNSPPVVVATAGNLTAFGSVIGVAATSSANYHYTCVTASAAASRLINITARGRWRA